MRGTVKVSVPRYSSAGRSFERTGLSSGRERHPDPAPGLAAVTGSVPDLDGLRSMADDLVDRAGGRLEAPRRPRSERG